MRHSYVFSLLTLTVLAGCATSIEADSGLGGQGSGDPTNGTGGSLAASGGNANTGGSSAGGGLVGANTGGTSTGGASTGGATSTGGSSSTGGATSTGGSVSTGGTTSTGGSASTGGATSTGGSSSGSCASPSAASGSAAQCGDTIVYKAALYECKSSNLGSCGTSGVYCQSIAPDDAAWGSTAWTKLSDCN